MCTDKHKRGSNYHSTTPEEGNRPKFPKLVEGIVDHRSRRSDVISPHFAFKLHSSLVETPPARVISRCTPGGNSTDTETEQQHKEITRIGGPHIPPMTDFLSHTPPPRGQGHHLHQTPPLSTVTVYQTLSHISASAIGHTWTRGFRVEKGGSTADRTPVSFSSRRSIRLPLPHSSTTGTGTPPPSDTSIVHRNEISRETYLYNRWW
ncbi:uncharacterized protein LOC130357403 [Hyla sarda]|uniref:uncharacterized protein LOC130357403 n=1 Tax=Hyla sarda TaxID=327740 RepID=UPI0024C3D24C|nr:uncharacterized protein LOC130357403 [Hyla sarda]